MLVCINYSDKKFIWRQKINSITARIFGGFDEVISFCPSNLDSSFHNKNQHILNQSRGGGFWLWKPYFILQTLEKLEEGDFLFYSDSGVIFIKSIIPLIKEFERLKQPILGFQLPLIEKQYTKKETFLVLNLTDQFFFDSPQICASYIFIQKTKNSVEFIQEYLNFCEDQAALTDEIYICPNESYFIDHRHDQSIFSLLYKKYGFEPLGDISDYGLFPEAYCQPENRMVQSMLKFPHYVGTVLSVRGTNPIIYTIKYFAKRFLKKYLNSYYNRRFNKRNLKFTYVD